MDRFLKPGMKLQLNGIDGTFVIRDLVGRGSSCVVYRTDFYNTSGVKSEHLLKEFNPKNINVTRAETFTLQIDQSEENIFEEEKQRFKVGFAKQVLLQEKTGLKNYTANIQNVYEDYNTVYIDMNVTEGKSYDTVVEKSIYDLARRMKVLAEVVGKYHENGYLHLDLKPNNIYVRPETETCEDVLLFDFDSVTEKCNLQGGGMLSYTKEWAALELTSTSRRNLICEATDIFSIGEIFFEKLMGRHSESWERRSFSKYVYDLKTPILENVNPKVLGLLDELFRRTLCNNVKSRYQSTVELISLLDEITKVSNPEKPYLKSSCPEPLEFFVGRDQELQDIHESLHNNNVLFLSGMGGIGKSELAKNYAKRYGADYDTVVFVPYVSDLIMAIADDNAIPIYNFYCYPEEKPEEYARRKFRKVKELCDNRTLIIVDNFDYMDDSLLVDFLKLNADILVTTRMDFSEYNRKQKKIGEIQNKKHIFDIFKQYYTKSMSAEEFTCVEQIIELVCGHTMTVELLAKQMMAGRVRPERMLETLRGVGIAGSGKEQINSGKDDRFERKSAYEHIRVMFDLSELNEKEEYILMNLSIIPYTGIPTEMFYEWCELENYETINQLIIEGWIRLDKEKDLLSLHPIISDIVTNKISKNGKVLEIMLNNGRKKRLYKYPVEQRQMVVTVLKHMLSVLYNREIESLVSAFFMRFVSDEIVADYDSRNQEKYLRRVISIRTNMLGADNEQTLTAYYSLTNHLRVMGKYSEAEKVCDKALDFFLRQFTSEEETFQNSEEYRTILRRLASIYSSQDKDDAAEEILQRQSRYYMGRKVSRDLVCKYQLGQISNKKGKYKEAIEYLEQCLEYLLQFDTEPARTRLKASCYLEMATSYRMLDDIEQANKKIKMSMELWNGIYTQDSMHFMLANESLGQNCVISNRLNEAEQYLKKSLELKEKIYGPEHVSLSKTYYWMSLLHEKYCDQEKALFYAMKSYEKRKEVLGVDHRLTKEAYSQVERLTQIK